MPGPYRIVILGAGFGGVAAAKALAKVDGVAVTVIDRGDAHVFWPLLYQVAAAELSPDEVAWPLRALLGRRARLTFAMATVEMIDAAGKTVRTDRGAFAYDALIVATGATHSFFGHDDWAQHATGLKTLGDALRVRRAILSAFERAELEAASEARARLTTFVIVGGGPTGVELAGALSELARLTLAGEFSRVDPRKARVILLEAGPRVLPQFTARTSDYARRALEKRGVEVRTDAAVTQVDAAGVSVGEERIQGSLVVWAAGVKAAIPAGLEGAPRDRSGRVAVGPDLAAPGLADVFVIGDAAAAQWDDARAVPGIAPAAKQMGRYVARRIAAPLQGRPPPPPFRYRHLGDYATIGRRAAIARYDHTTITGAPAWWLWGAIHIVTLIAARNRLSVAASWAYTYLTRQRGARLILGVGE